MSLLKDAVVEAIKIMPENVRAKDINNEIRLIGQIIEELKETENIKTITTDEILKRVNLKIQEC
jgi:argonaute-like protein implicated in RNA metabolism and viral defense